HALELAQVFLPKFKSDMAASSSTDKWITGVAYVVEDCTMMATVATSRLDIITVNLFCLRQPERRTCPGSRFGYKRVHKGVDGVILLVEEDDTNEILSITPTAFTVGKGDSDKGGQLVRWIWAEALRGNSVKTMSAAPRAASVAPSMATDVGTRQRGSVVGEV
ncbi:hypothetical protein BDZ89DRAFT_1055120, partial [Hymenopellis radicata]